MKKILISLSVFALILSGCGSTNREHIAYDTAAEPEMAAEQGARAAASGGIPEAAEQPSPEKKKIIRSGRMGIQVRELPGAKRQADSLVRSHGGYYASENYSATHSQPEYTLAIRIPGEKYDAFLSAVEGGMGKTLYKEVSARDVTEEYLDVQTRLANKRSYLERYRELVKRAGSIKEVLVVEEQIRQLEEEIESAEGRLRYMDDRVAYSSLDLVLSTEYKYAPSNENKFSQRLLRALSTGWKGIVNFFLGMVYLWPLWILAAGVLLGWRYLRKRNKK